MTPSIELFITEPFELNKTLINSTLILLITTYTQFFKNINEYFIFFIFLFLSHLFPRCIIWLRINACHWPCYSGRWRSLLAKNIPFRFNFIFDIRTHLNWLYYYWITNSILPNVFCSHQLRVPIIDYFINNFIN